VSKTGNTLIVSELEAHHCGGKVLRKILFVRVGIVEELEKSCSRCGKDLREQEDIFKI
jgi:hypothetical protein